MKTMLKHKRMNAPKEDDLKDVAKEETMGMPVKGKEAKKNQEMDEAVDKKDSDVKKISKADGRGGEKVDGEEEQKANTYSKEDAEEVSRRIQGLEPPQDDLEEELKEEKEDKKTESLKKVSTDKKDSLEKKKSTNVLRPLKMTDAERKRKVGTHSLGNA